MVEGLDRCHINTHSLLNSCLVLLKFEMDVDEEIEFLLKRTWKGERNPNFVCED